MGGPAALKEGIAAVHEKGGRVILYVEGFIISQDSHVGMTHGGREWSIIGPRGRPNNPIPETETLSGAEARPISKGAAANLALNGNRRHLLDSEGFQKDWKCLSRKHGHRPEIPVV